ncbi:hypothetical protein GCM10022238_33380 [Gordonia hankookensis]
MTATVWPRFCIAIASDDPTRPHPMMTTCTFILSTALVPESVPRAVRAGRIEPTRTGCPRAPDLRPLVAFVYYTL